MKDEICNDENDKFSLHNLQNRNGEYLTDFSLKSSLLCLKTKFKTMEIKLWIYTYPKMLVYELSKKKWINRAMNCEALSSFERVSSDNRIVLAKIHPSLRRNKKQKVKNIHYAWSSHTNRDINNKCTVIRKSSIPSSTHLKVIFRIGFIKNFVTAFMEAAVQCILNKSKARCRVP